MTPTTLGNIHDRFYAKVDRNGPVPAHRPELGPCHVWTASLRRGYGQVRFAGKHRLAHRVAFYLANGRWPEPECCHHCDNSRCVNAEHLFEGTRTTNSADMVSKGRSASGERCPRSRITEQDVRDIRANYALCRVTQRELASRFGVSRDEIGLIVRRKVWRHA